MRVLLLKHCSVRSCDVCCIEITANRLVSCRDSSDILLRVTNGLRCSICCLISNRFLCYRLDLVNTKIRKLLAESINNGFRTLFKAHSIDSKKVVHILFKLSFKTACFYFLAKVVNSSYTICTVANVMLCRSLGSTHCIRLCVKLSVARFERKVFNRLILIDQIADCLLTDVLGVRNALYHLLLEGLLDFLVLAFNLGELTTNLCLARRGCYVRVIILRNHLRGFFP